MDKRKLGKEMKCTMPNIMHLTNTLDQTKIIHTTLYFLMDGIEELRLLKKNPTLSRYLYQPNPVLSKFSEDDHLKVFDIAEEFLAIKVRLL